jgi:sugar phosphate isomerase/epimerase
VLFFVGYDKRIADGAEYYKKYFNAAAELGAKYVVFHGNNMKNRFCGFERYCEIFQYINSKAEPFGVELIHENVSVSVAADPGNIRMLRKTCPDMRFVFDAKQACRGGFDPYEVLDAIGDAVVHVHINDYDLKNRECRPPCKGDLDLRRILRKLRSLGYSGDMVVEVYRENFSDISELSESAAGLKKLVEEINAE